VVWVSVNREVWVLMKVLYTDRLQDDIRLYERSKDKRVNKGKGNDTTRHMNV